MIFHSRPVHSLDVVFPSSPLSALCLSYMHNVSQARICPHSNSNNNDDDDDNNSNNNNNNIIIMMMMMMMMMMIIIIIIIIIIIVIVIIIIITTTTTTTTTTIIIIIAFKDAIRDFFFLQSPHCAANRLQHIHSSSPGAIVCKSRATHRALITCNMPCYVPRGTKPQLGY